MQVIGINSWVSIPVHLHKRVTPKSFKSGVNSFEFFPQLLLYCIPQRRTNKISQRHTVLWTPTRNQAKCLLMLYRSFLSNSKITAVPDSALKLWIVEDTSIQLQLGTSSLPGLKNGIQEWSLGCWTKKTLESWRQSIKIVWKRLMRSDSCNFIPMLNTFG